jgi:hypothetical protein
MLRRALILAGLVAYAGMTLLCAASIVVAVVTEAEAMGLVGSALVVFYAGETLELVRWLRRPNPCGAPALHPAWGVPCAVLGFALATGLALWVRGA